MLRFLLWKWLSGILFLFDAESIHRKMIALVRFLKPRQSRWILRVVSGADQLETGGAKRSQFECAGLMFRSPVGLAAGFDKDCEILDALCDLGFGFAEIGTVTPLPQSGNPRPRMFRDRKQQALFNRMGFNSAGASVVSKRLSKIKPKLPESFLVGVNVGKNRSTTLEKAHLDYAQCVAPFQGLADYLVLNVSSPNTPGLRSLQEEESLKRLVGSVQNEVQMWQKVPPLFLKLAPELEEKDLETLVPSLEREGIEGWIMTNTLAGIYAHQKKDLMGGWSGKILTDASRASLKVVRGLSEKGIISVGGIFSEEEAALRLSLGANLVQIYTGWVMNGPRFPSRIVEHVSKQTH